MGNRKIMIVEDEVVVSFDLQSKLEKLGYEVNAVVRYGEKAFDAAMRNHPDLVLMDIKLKGAMDGVEAAQKIREQLDIPIVFLSAYSDEATLAKAKAAEPFAYLKKPITLEELRVTAEIALYKADMERKLRESEIRYRTVADFTYDCEMWIGPEGQYLYISPSCKRITGYSREEFFENPQLLYSIVHPLDRKAFQEHMESSYRSDTGFIQMEFRIIRSDGEERWIEHLCQPVHGPDGKYLGRRAGNRDISDRRKMEQEREGLIIELQKALAEVRKLSGMLPICSSCKKIRDDKGYWNQIESYIREHSEAEFTHSICPECAKRLYPNLKIFDEKE